MRIAFPAQLPSRGFISLLYIAATGIFLIGLQSFLAACYEINLVSAMLAAASNGFAAVYRLTSWTLYGFIPLVAILMYLTWRRTTIGPLDAKTKRICELVEVLAYALGILGPITQQVFKTTDASSGGGFGSLTLGILCWVWSVVICFDLQERQPVTVTHQCGASTPDE
jgi:Na+/proline symporter